MPVILDRISTDWVLGPGNDLLAHYRGNRVVANGRGPLCSVPDELVAAPEDR